MGKGAGGGSNGFFLLALFLVGGNRAGGGVGVGGSRGGVGVGGVGVVRVVLGTVRLLPVSSWPEGEVVVGGMSFFFLGNVVGFLDKVTLAQALFL